MSFMLKIILCVIIVSVSAEHKQNESFSKDGMVSRPFAKSASEKTPRRDQIDQQCLLCRNKTLLDAILYYNISHLYNGK